MYISQNEISSFGTVECTKLHASEAPFLSSISGSQASQRLMLTKKLSRKISMEDIEEDVQNIQGSAL